MSVRRIERVQDVLNQQKLPAGPLLAAIEASGVQYVHGDPVWRQVSRIRARGTATVAAVDRLSIDLLRAHPAEIYGEEWWA